MTMADIRSLEDKTKSELDEVCRIFSQIEQLFDIFSHSAYIMVLEILLS